MRQPVPFGKYLLLDRISVGGMAEVFKAKSYGVEGFEKIIAIKRILPTMGEDRDFIKMFIDEAKIAGQLAHANICQIFELGRIDGSHFIAMEYIWGKDLLQIQNRLRKLKQPMPIAMACFTMAKVLEGLDYAHRKRDPLGRPLEIVHRDCSPQNVLVSYEGEVKVIDFGIAKATSRNSRTMAGVLKGKFGYMSPEQVRGLPLDRRSDLFALGTMLYECLTGDRLFQGETDFSTLEKVRNVDIRPPREINPDIPQSVEAVILKALAKDVEERYQWCSEMLADLQAFLMSQDVVFTAKSLSGWLKDVFAPEIERERQQLEQYKRVGRDGLIAGVPAAEAKLDVVATLGEAPPVEGDPTTLGDPSFEDVEQAAGAAPEVGPAPGSPAARGGPLEDDEGTGDFGEEAPTEIFGEINHGANPIAAKPASASRVTPLPQPATRPPKPPPGGRPTTSRSEAGPPAALAAQPALPGLPPSPGASPNQPPSPGTAPVPGDAGFAPAAPAQQSGFAMQSYANPANAGAPYQQFSPSGPGYTPAPKLTQPSGQPGVPPPIALGTPGAMPVTPSQLVNGVSPPSPAQGRTLIGATAPAGLPNYAQGYPPPGGLPGMQPPGMMPPGMMPPGIQSPGMPPGAPGLQPPGMLGYPGSLYPQSQAQLPSNGYGASGQYLNAASPVEQVVPSGKRKSSIARDVGIGVAIAALVLGGFLVVKFFVLDSDSASPEPAPPASSLATIRISLASGSSAELFVDDKKIATVSDTQEIPVTSGQRKVKLVGPSGALCEKDVTLAAGKVTPLECAARSTPPAGGSGGGSAASSVGPGSGATVSTESGTGSGSGAGSGSAAAGATPGSAEPGPGTTPSDHPVPDKTDKMPVEDKGKPTDSAGGKLPDKAADKVAVKLPEKPADKQGRPPDKQGRPPDKQGRPAPADDDLLGSLQGGSKSGGGSSGKPGSRPADAKGYATITSTPAARIMVDGKDTGLSTPISGHALPLPPGKHKVTFAIGAEKFSFFINIKAGETTPLHKDLQ